jgi:4-hydroxybenzoate polyprenyltransferase
MNKILSYFSLIKFAHTVFSLPFAVVGFLMAVNETGRFPGTTQIVAVLLCLVLARNSAMSFNRWVDSKIDALNPRTRNREIPANIISRKSAFLFAFINAALFMASAWFINSLAFYLSPVAVLVIWGYSYTKRVTWLCHFVLGAALMIAPAGAFLAVSGDLNWQILFLSFAVLFWVAGFDILYSIQDMHFDKQTGLFSIPSQFGAFRALTFSRIAHVLATVCLAGWWFLFPEPSWMLLAGILFFVIFLFRQHLLIKPGKFENINPVFFASNGMASIIFGCFYFFHFFITYFTLI